MTLDVQFKCEYICIQIYRAPNRLPEKSRKALGLVEDPDLKLNCLAGALHEIPVKICGGAEL